MLHLERKGQRMSELVIYHGNCVDGFASAWAHWMNGGRDRDVEYVPAFYGGDEPDFEGKDVHILDFCYKRERLEDIAKLANSVLVLDHHKTAAEDLEPLLTDETDAWGARIGGGKGLQIRFDMNRSGAGMAWDYYSAAYAERPNLDRPWIISYVEDRDLWRFNLSHSKEANAYLQSLPKRGPEDFDAWKTAFAEGVGRACNIGKSLIGQVNDYVDMMRGHAREAFVRRPDGTVESGLRSVNAPYWSCSELVGSLAEDVPEAFAFAWFRRGDGKVAYMLRSRGDFDVSELAKQFGGGGHPKAAGFVVDVVVHTSRNLEE
jgi:hypothetical protein